MSVTISVEGGAELIAKLNTLEKMQRVRSAIVKEAYYLAGKLRVYPQKVQMANPLIKSNDKVRRGFFYHLKHGNITVPYARGSGKSERLGARWSVASESQGWRAVVGNNASYASLVQGEKQTGQHAASGWLTVEKAEQEYSAGIIARITRALEEEVANV